MKQKFLGLIIKKNNDLKFFSLLLFLNRSFLSFLGIMAGQVNIRIAINFELL